MVEQYKDVTHTSYLDNVLNSFLIALFALLLFVASFFVLWINEGRVNPAKVAQTSVSITAGAVEPAMDGKLVAATGTLATTEQLGDSSYLQPGNYLALKRTVEMYAWTEETKSTTKRNSDGSSTTETTYTYEREWTSQPEDSDSFRYGGHSNPPMPLKSESWTVQHATLDAFQVDPQALTLPDEQPVVLHEENAQPSAPWRLSGEYLVNREGALSQPKVGDTRISYTVVPNSIDVTLFGKVSGNQIVPFEGKGVWLYRAFTENREQAITRLNTEYQLSIWIIRFFGFMMMWIGLSACFGPISAVLNILPFLGNASRSLIGASTFVVAFVLSVLTILASIIMHNIFLLIGVLLLIGGIVAWRNRGLKLTMMKASA